jgi:uncharacterized protein (TIGR02145 family)
MKNRIACAHSVLALLALPFLFGCKASQPTGPGAPTASVSEVARVLDTIQFQELNYADSANGDARGALQRTGNWLATLPNIQSEDVLDSSYLYFTLKSGLTGLYYLNDVDDSGLSITRGGKGGGAAVHRWSTLSNHTITNKSVLIFAPVFEEFYNPAQFQAILDALANSGLGLSVTAVKDSLCTTDVVNSFGNYGLVIIDTHGAPNGFLIGTAIEDTFTNNELRLKTEIAVDLGETGYANFQAGQLMLARGLNFNGSTPSWPKAVKRQVNIHYYYHIVLTSNYIAGMPKLNGTVLYGNMCFSGYSQPVPPKHGPMTGIETAFMGLNPISYYGYAYADGTSATVYNGFAKQMEDSLILQLITNSDSTGHCYLSQDGSEFIDKFGLENGLSKQNLYFKHFGANDYSYMRCGDTLLDARDGQKYATVCIGTQTWMAQNLDYNAPGSLLYNNDPANGPIYGRLYNWKTVMQGAAPSTANPSGVQGICPKGWHVPSPAEYAVLVAALGGNAVAGGAMKSTSYWQSPNTGATNSSGFFATPAGQSEATEPISNVGIVCNLWDTYQDAANPSPNGDLWGGAYTLYYSSPGISSTESYQIYNYSCRCVKDP